MPAYKEEISQAENEGVKMHFLCNPVKFFGNGKVSKMECLRMKLGEFDSSGRRRPVPSEGSEFALSVDFIITAIGQRPDLSFDLDHFEMKVSKRGTALVNPEDLSVNKNGAFAGGDLVTGPSTVINAIEHGIKAAISIDKYLGGKSIIEESIRKQEKLDEMEPSQDNLDEQPRVKKIKNHQRISLKDFQEVEAVYSDDEAFQEASRCLRCDLQVD